MELRNSKIRIALVVPCRGDAVYLQGALLSLEPFITAGDFVAVVNADGCPRTEAVARLFAVQVINSIRPERGPAIKAGIDHVLANELPNLIIVVHADMRLHPDTRRMLETRWASAACISWGFLGHKISERLFKYRIVEAGNHFRASVLALPYGDQGMFFTPELLAKVGGFPDITRMEDAEFSLRAARISRPTYVSAPVTINARHWHQGVLHTTGRNWIALGQYVFRDRQRPGGSKKPIRGVSPL